jgi:type I restriction enzyme S subunit
MSEWQACTLSDVLKFGNGKSRPKGYGEIPVYGGNGILDYTNCSNYTEKTIVIGRVGAYCGATYYEDKNIWVSDNALSAKALHGNDPKFLYYFLKNLDLNQFAQGSSHPLLTQTLLNSIEVIVPLSCSEQKAIASVLSSLDDKIDLLHRQNKTLEAMAETLFRQRFIEEASEDWEEVTLADVCTRITDGSHSSPASVESGYSMASVKDMHDWGINELTCRKIADEDYEALVKADCKALKDDILIAKDGSYLKHVFLLEESLDVVLLSSIAMLRPNGVYNAMLLTLFLKLDSTHELMQNIVTGAVIPRIVLKDFRKFPIQLPPKVLQEKAVEVIEPIFKKCWENNRQIQTLEQLRDILLPKLMSGEVRVEWV